MELGLEGKVAAIGGASAGLGKAVAWSLAREGARVAICARGAERLDRTRRALERASGREVFAYTVDLSTEEGPREFIEATAHQFGGLDILVCNAGGPPPTTLANTSGDAWEQAINLSLLSTVRLVQAAIPQMKRQQWGRIICLTSVTVKSPLPGMILSNTARPGVVGFAKTVANEYAHHGITVNVICPGWMLTDRVQELAEDEAGVSEATVQDVMNRIVENIPTGRMGDPKELGDLVAFLASERAAYITGTAIQIDGGFVQGLY